MSASAMQGSHNNKTVVKVVMVMAMVMFFL